MRHDDAANLLVSGYSAEDHEGLREFIGLPGDLVTMSKETLWMLLDLANALGIQTGGVGALLGGLLMHGCVVALEEKEVGFLREEWAQKDERAQAAIKLMTAVMLDHVGGKVKV